jgi:pseudouridine-5'-phosphate glycosidase/pseudouridine kinase
MLRPPSVTVSTPFISANIDIEMLLKEMPDLIEEGTVQQAIQMLPYIPNILVKLGPRGTLSVRLVPKNNDVKGLRLPGVHADVVVRHHPATQPHGIVSVTGAGYHLLLLS